MKNPSIKLIFRSLLLVSLCTVVLTSFKNSTYEGVEQRSQANKDSELTLSSDLELSAYKKCRRCVWKFCWEFKCPSTTKPKPKTKPTIKSSTTNSSSPFTTVPPGNE